MTTRRRTSPEDARKIADHVREHLACPDCGSAPSQPCDRPGPGRTVHKSRYIAAAIEVRQQDRAAQRTPEQAADIEAVLAGLPQVSAQEIEAARSPRGGWTRATLAGWGIPWPPPAGWRRALLRGEDDNTSTQASGPSQGPAG